jgi:outer membrane protein assembly factor BamD
VNRAQAAIVNFPRTPSNEDALELLVRAYDKLGLEQLRDDSRRVLQQSFPDSGYLSDASDRPWWKFWQSDSRTLAKDPPKPWWKPW